MKRMLKASVFGFAILLTAAVASAQVALPVSSQGTVYRYYYSGSPSTSGFFSGSPMFAGRSTSSNTYTYTSGGYTYTTTYGYYTTIAQGVVKFSLSPYGTALPMAANADLTFFASSAFGTWTLWAHASDTGSLSTADFVNTGSPGPGFTAIGTQLFGSAGPDSFAFDITAALNDDLTAGRAFSSYTLTHQGSITPVVNAPVSYSPVPEPGTLALVGFGLVGLLAGHRLTRRRR